MKTPNETPIQPMEDQPEKPQYIHEQHNHNCQQFFGPVTGCVFAMPGAVVNQYPNAAATQTAAPSKPAPEDKTQPATRNPQLIIDYVMRLHPMYVRREWREKYEALWQDILCLPAVAKEIYDPHGQKDNNPDSNDGKPKFNRNLVANILCVMKEKNVFIENNATELKRRLEGEYNNSVREQLGTDPKLPEVENLINKYSS